MSEHYATPASALARLITRRTFVAGSLAIGAGALVAGCAPNAPLGRGAEPTATPLPPQEKYEHVPFAPEAPPEPGTLRFFTPDEARAAEALFARIIPGTPADPGAREAGVVTYVDFLLGSVEGFAEPTYTPGPHAKEHEGDAPPPPEDGVVWVKKDQMARYGFQSALSPHETYRKGLAQLDRYCRGKHGKPFADLAEPRQDEVIGDMADGKTTGFDSPKDKGFFKALRADAIDGMFADPAYGGNRGMVGWKLVKYPGAQRAYTPLDLKTEGTRLPPQDLAHLPHFHPGQGTRPGVILPVSGSDHQRR